MGSYVAEYPKASSSWWQPFLDEVGSYLHCRQQPHYAIIVGLLVLLVCTCGCCFVSLAVNAYFLAERWFGQRRSSTAVVGLDKNREQEADDDTELAAARLRARALR